MQKFNFNEREIIVNNTWAGVLGAYMEDIPFRNHVGNGAVFEQDMILDMLEPYIKRAKYICDIGGHTGHHSLAYAHLNPDAKIYTFEPQTDMYKLLELNIYNNKPKTKNIQILNMALGNSHEVLTMKEGTFGVSAYIGEGGETINGTKLDLLNLPGCDYMKIDVEGYEPLVINGGIETIKKFRPFICFEDNGASIKNGITELSTHEILEQLEYKIHPLVYDNFLGIPIVKSNFKNCSGA